MIAASAYRTIYLASTQIWWFIAAGGFLRSFTTTFQDGDAALQQRYRVDHLVELNMIIGFFSLPWNANDFPGISLNQYITVQDFLKDGGATAVPLPTGDNWVSFR